jgi:lactoylglutathione lyase
VSSPSLNLLVLRAADIERTGSFYSVLGLSLVQEKHGCGPVHYSCDLGTMVLEIYPAGSIGAEPGTGMMGFTVSSLSHVLPMIESMGCSIVTAPASSDRGLRAVVKDPDGRRVELIEKFSIRSEA